uniref:Uncharacterized protein n=1 Tax=Glossina austeni TaxID=7395 RepID=A0A1A9VWX4_GLOAU
MTTVMVTTIVVVVVVVVVVMLWLMLLLMSCKNFRLCLSQYYYYYYYYYYYDYCELPLLPPPTVRALQTCPTTENIDVRISGVSAIYYQHHQHHLMSIAIYMCAYLLIGVQY